MEFSKDSEPQQLQQASTLAGNVAKAHNDQLKFLSHLKELNTADREALCAMISQKNAVIGKYDTFEQLMASGDQNGLLGHAFEELISGKVLAAAKKQGIHLERIQGDGLGTLPNGQRTPQHSDLVFKDGNGRLYSKQMKFSDSRDNINEMVKKFLNTHGEKPNTSGYRELDVGNTDIIVPKGLDKQDIRV